MGFPMAYTDLFLPKALVRALTFLNLIRRLIHNLLSLTGLGSFLILGPEPPMPPPPPNYNTKKSISVYASLVRELLPVVRYDQISVPPSSDACRSDESCAVCLYEFEGDDEIRRLANCRHVFHRACVDRWIDHDQKTCPLCRTPFVPEDMEEAFNERLWTAASAGIASDFNL